MFDDNKMCLSVEQMQHINKLGYNANYARLLIFDYVGCLVPPSYKDDTFKKIDEIYRLIKENNWQINYENNG